MKCNHVNRVPIAMGRGHTVIGGVPVGECQNKAVPGMVVCLEHANKEALGMLINDLLADYQKATGKPHRYAAPSKK